MIEYSVVDRGKVKWILVPCVVRYRVEDEIKRTFEDEDGSIIKIIRLTDMIVTNYASDLQVNELRKEILNRFNEFRYELYAPGDEVYLLLTGSNLNVSEVTKLLEEAGIPYKRLVYEKKVGRYVVV